jgi:phospholipase D-like protein
MNIFGGSMGGVGVLAMVFWIWMLVDCLTNEPKNGSTRLIWVLVILFGHILGAILYFFIRRPVRMGRR